MSEVAQPPWLLPDLDGFVAGLPRHIPLLGPMRLALHRADADGLVLTAPLRLNHNDKGTAFAGSIGTLAVVTGWAVATLAARALGHDVDAAATRLELDFTRPLASDLCARCAWPAPAATLRMARGLTRHRLSRLDLVVSVSDPQGLAGAAASARLRYAVRSPPTDGRRED